MSLNSATFLARLSTLVGMLLVAACGGNAPGEDAPNGGSSSSASSSSSSASSSSGGDMSGGLAYLSADGIKGGQLYATFWASETGFDLSNSSLKDQSQLDEIVAKAEFFRCAHCHGWDRLGRYGGHSNRAPTTSRPRVADVDLVKIGETANPQVLFDRIKNGVNYRSVNENLDTYDPQNNSAIGDSMPSYAEILTDDQIWDLVKFLKEEALDTSALYDIIFLGDLYPRSRGFLNMGVDGSEVAGAQLFAEQCSICHGIDGTKLSLDDGLYTVGRYIRSKPYEAQHIVKFGHLGSIMGPVLRGSPLSDFQDLFAAMRDVEKFPDSKSDSLPEPEPIDGAQAFLRHCSGCHSGGGEGPFQPRYGDVTGASASLISTMIETEPNMRHLKPDDPAQAVSLEEVAAIAAFLQR